jgi:SAM-dependent methyltransferase
MDDSGASFYNKIAKSYYETKGKIYPKKDLDKFLSYIEPSSSILDLGCGPGQASKIFCERKYLVTGLDFSEEMLKIAKKEAPCAKFILEDIRNIDKIFRNELFEGIWACSSFLHIPKKEMPSVFNQVYNLLKNQGRFYIAVKEGEGEKDWIDEEHGNIKRHLSYFKKGEIIKLLKSSKLEPIYFSFNRSLCNKDSKPIWINFIAKKS